MFDTALLEPRGTRRAREKAAAMPLAIGLHVAVLGAFIGAAVWNTGEPPEPVIPVTFFAPAAGPRPPLGDGGRARAITRSPSPPPRSDVVPANLLADPVVPKPSLQPADEGPNVSGEEPTGPSGEPNGVPGGTGHGPGEGEGSGLGQGTEPIRVGGDVKAPVLVLRVEPEYPEAMRRAHMQGVVILEAVINASGEVGRVGILKSAGPLLDRESVAAVRQWRYEPATLNGRAVSVYLTVTVTFGLTS